jgi:ATP-dependent helicase/DNAse subunit B
VVTDYKSARDVGKLARQGDGLGIQHVIYAVAAQELVGRPVQGSVYRSLRTRRLRGFWREDRFDRLPEEACPQDVVDDAGFSALVDAVSQKVTFAVEGITAGRIPCSPRTAASCTYCSLSAICQGARP